MESDLAQTRVKLEEALERVKFVQHVVTVDLPCVTVVSFSTFVLDSWSFIGCLSALVPCFAGSGGDVEPQVPFPPNGACSDGAGGHGIVAGHRA